MITQEVIDKIKDLEISEVISQYIPLKQKGPTYIAPCPFHGEKTPSFHVNPRKGIFKCFGCGVAGDAISFVQKYLSLGFIESCFEIAGKFSIQLPQKEYTPEEQTAIKKRETLFAVNALAASWFRDNLHKPENSKALEYVRSRWSDESITEFMIGFAPDSFNTLLNWARDNGVNQAALIELGILKENKEKDRLYDFFRNRIMFPIHNKSGRITGFTGRDFSGKEDVAKYQNSPESEIFKKGKILFGLNTAYFAIREKGYVHLVEGHADVIRMHQIGKLNTICSGGTALTHDQIEIMGRVTKSITLVGDSDKAGELATLKNGSLIIQSGMFCNVIPLPAGEIKNDPDSFFTSEDQFDKYAKENIIDYVFYFANVKKEKAKSPDLKSKLISDLCDLIIKLPPSSHELYIEQLGKIITPKKAFTDQIKALQREIAIPVEEDNSWKIPATISLDAWEKYGFYEDRNCYFFKSKDGVMRGSNFTMEPLFHIASVVNAKRLYKITNENHFSQVIELAQKDLISLAAFKLRIESLGNFLFEGQELHLNRLKRFLYEETKSCTEITQLGWQKQGFWAWCNGIYNGSFIQTDSNGIVTHDKINYYLPATSGIYQGEDNLFVSERRFRYREGKVSFFDISKKLIDVYGDPAIIGLCFYIAVLFRDYIYKLFGFFPILNLFGPKGAGKTEMAVSLLQFFGSQSKGPNLTNTTKPAIADHIAMFSNTLSHLDEYKNNIEYEKIEMLKSLWDGTGRTRMNMDKDRKKETTPVDVGVMVSGQEMPTADIALYSRLIFLSFNKVEYTDNEKTLFNDLKEVEKTGLTHITHDMLSFRDQFIATFMSNYNIASTEITEKLDGYVIEDRIFRNWVIPVASFRTLERYIRVPWSYDHLIDKAVSLMKLQNLEVKKGNEVSIFWSIFEFLVQDGQIREEIDFKIDNISVLKTDKVNIEFNEPTEVIYVNHTRVFQLYRIHGKKSSDNILPLKTLEYYLTNSKEYFGKKSAVAFKVPMANDNRTIDEIQDANGNFRRKITTAMTFDYKSLDISVTSVSKTESEWKELEDNEKKPVPEPEFKTVTGDEDLPF